MKILTGLTLLLLTSGLLAPALLLGAVICCEPRMYP